MMADLGEVLDEDVDDDDITPPDYDVGMDMILFKFTSHSSFIDSTKWSAIVDSNVKVTLDGARSASWEHAKCEITFIREKVRAFLGKKKVTVSLLIDLFFGEDSEMYIAFSRQIPMSHETFLRFLGVFFLGSCHNKSCTQMYGEHSFIRSYAENLLPRSFYVEIWDRIAQANLPVAMGQTTFWLTVQAAFNAACRKLFIVGVNEQLLRLLIILDDDKIHFETRKSESDGLKVVRHVNDNRTGHVMHTAVLSNSGMIIGVEAERSEDDSIGSATERLLLNQLRPSHGTNRPPNLRNVELYSDRAYWSPAFHKWILDSGADIGASTRKRSQDFPFTFDQKLRPNDAREDIPTSGFKRLFTKTSNQQGREVTAVAYRNNGNVTLGLTTKFGGQNWDLVLQDPKDAINVSDPAWKLTSIIETALVDFEDADGEKEKFRQLLSNLSIDWVTTDQNSPGWFLMRSFSITSSAADIVLQELYKDFKLRKLHASITTAANFVFNFIYTNVPPIEQDDESTNSDVDSESETNDSSSDSADSSSDETDEKEFDINDLDRNISSWNQGGGITDMMEALVGAEHVSMAVLSGYLSRMGGTAKTRTKCVEAIKEWLQSSVKKRPLLFLTKPQLIEMLAEKQGGSASSYNRFSKPVLIEKLMGNDNEMNSESQLQLKELWKRLVACVLKSTCMPKLTGKGKEYAKLGHKNEELLLKALLNCRDNPHKLNQIVRPGLVSKQNYPYVKTSVDAIGLIKNDDDDLELVGIELKSRVTNSTYQEEIITRDEMSDGRIYEEIDIEQEHR